MQNARWIILLLGCLAYANGFAQAKDQPIQIEANSAEYSDRTGISTYTGDVVLSQAGLTLRGNTLTVTRNEDNGNIEAVLEGKPATLNKPADSQSAAPVKGRAQSMEYNSRSATIMLRGDAYVNRGGDQISGEVITHDLNSARTQADSAKNGGRVKITIQPDSADNVAPLPNTEDAADTPTDTP